MLRSNLPAECTNMMCGKPMQDLLWENSFENAISMLDTMIDTNVKAMMYVPNRAAIYDRKEKGHIINMGICCR